MKYFLKQLFLEKATSKIEVNKAVVIIVVVMIPLILAGAAYAQWVNHHVSK
jgi:cytochrome bd-type quinol oxidase subunit 2